MKANSALSQNENMLMLPDLCGFNLTQLAFFLVAIVNVLCTPRFYTQPRLTKFVHY